MSIDSRLYRTMRGLFISLGRVAHDYVSGHRVRYTPPFRIYLFFSLVFFASLFLVINRQSATGESGNEIVQISTEADAPTLIEEDDREEDEIDFQFQGPEVLEKYARKIIENFEKVEEDPRLFLANVRKNIPRVMLLMPVVYMLLLLIFYFYRKNVYVYDLLIISLYMHGALYFYLSLAILYQWSPLDKIIFLSMLDELLLMWAGLQSFFTLSINFGSKWYMVLIKGLLINMGFWTVAGILIFTGLAISFVY